MNNQKKLAIASLNNVTQSIDSNTSELKDNMPLTKSYHRDIKTEYIFRGPQDQLLECNEFTDKHIIKEFNKTEGNKKLIKDYIDTIKSDEHSLGSEASKKLCSKLTKTTYEKDSSIIDKTIQVIKNDENMPQEVIEDVGHSLIQVYDAVGNLPKTDALSWFVSQVNFGPNKQLESPEIKAQKLDTAMEYQKQTVADLERVHEISMKELETDIINKLNETWLDKVLNKFDMAAMMNTMLTHKVVLGGSAIAIVGGVSWAIYKNPQTFAEWRQIYKSDNSTNAPTTGTAENKTYKTVSQIEKEALTTSSNIADKKIAEIILDRFYIALKEFFFKKDFN